MRTSWLLAIALVACDGGTDSGSEPSGPSGPATLTPDCAPDDGPALTLRAGLDEASCGEDFVAPDGPWVRIALWTDLPEADGDRVEITADNGKGGIWWYPDGGTTDWHALTDGSVTFDSYTPDGPASGTYTVVLEDGSSLSGTFDASFCDEEPLCG